MHKPLNARGYTLWPFFSVKELTSLQVPTEFYLFNEAFNEIHLFWALPTLVYVLGESVNEAKSL